MRLWNNKKAQIAHMFKHTNMHTNIFVQREWCFIDVAVVRFPRSTNSQHNVVFTVECKLAAIYLDAL